MKLWRYIHYDVATHVVLLPHEYKEPEVWSETSPGPDYIEITGDELEQILISGEKGRYPDREKAGKDFAYTMDARLIILGKKITDPEVSEDVRAKLDAMFKNVRFEVSLGRWRSAAREIDQVVEDPSLQTIIDTHSLDINQANLIIEIKLTIDAAIAAYYD